MSFHTKSLTIPEHVPVGAVIGKRGCYCKALAANHKVRCFVDGDNRKVTLKGPSSGVSGAEDELATLFTSLAVANNEARVFEVAVRDGSAHCWSFQKTDEATSETEVEEYPYRLQQSGPATETPDQEETWAKEFHEEDTANLMSYLLEKPSELPPKFKIAFGMLCFKLKSARCESSTFSWQELQKLRKFDDFSTRWTNFCRRSSPSLVNLMDELEEWMEKGEELCKCLTVHLADNEKRYDLKYHLVDGQWELLKVYSKRHVRGTYDILLDNDTSLRVRAVTREKISDNTAADLHRYLDILIPDDGDFFHSKVMLKETAPTGMSIKSFNVQSKVQVVANGLRFSICYLDQSQDEFRLECRLTSEEKEKLGATDNEAQVLLEKALQALS
ncbi:hypothetical protein P3T76_008716 [Phytophthora citrophthora]|uniref:K Homology domain-containing protein n=1 Tax=Phytophthora citrophthora TaxID=4793 RepID=A0AAD9GJ08_9STRA|nr:hypothetical protein P3T76_008716 [Phytophthora citrophthora]